MAEITKVFLNTWHHYNEGYIGFGWMTTDEARAFMEAHEGQTEFEEWFIADIDNYTGFEFGSLEYACVDTVLDMIDKLQELNDDEVKQVVAILEYTGFDDINEAIERLGEYTMWSSLDNYHEFCDELIEEQLQANDSIIARYFDYESYHRDCDFDVYIASNGVCFMQ